MSSAHGSTAAYRTMRWVVCAFIVGGLSEDTVCSLEQVMIRSKLALICIRSTSQWRPEPRAASDLSAWRCGAGLGRVGERRWAVQNAAREYAEPRLTSRERSYRRSQQATGPTYLQHGECNPVQATQP